MQLHLSTNSFSIISITNTHKEKKLGLGTKRKTYADCDMLSIFSTEVEFPFSLVAVLAVER